MLALVADPKPHLLFVDDEADLRGPTAERLSDRGYEVVQAASGEQALELLDQFAFDLIVTDFRLPGMDGTQLIDAARQRYPSIVAIVITGYGTVRDAVDAIKRGASDFITKPFHFDELMHVIQKSMEQGRLRSENAYLRSQLEERYQFEGIIGRSRAMQPLFSMLETVARTASTVLITGETGTGKEVIANAIHHNSPRKTHRFVAINCGAIPETLLEAELFGHEQGAFTGAIAHAAGPLRACQQGHAVPRRGGNDEPGTADQAAARAAGARLRAGRRQPDHQGGRARHRRHQLGAAEDDCRGHVPRRSLLPAQRHPDFAAAAARSPRRHSAPGHAFPEEVRARRAAADVAGRDARAHGLRLARKRAAARERHRAGRDAERRAAGRST